MTRFEQYLPWNMIYITTCSVKMLLNIVLSPDEYFLLIWVLYLSHARYRSWPGLKGPVCAFTLVFQKFSREIFWKNILLPTTYIIWGNNILKEYMEYSRPFVLASRLLAIHLPGPKRPQECSLGLKLTLCFNVAQANLHYGTSGVDIKISRKLNYTASVT